MQTSDTSGDPGFHAAPTGGETMNGSHLLVEAYAAIWLCAIVFVFIMFRKTRDLEARVRVLKDAVAAARGRPAPKAASEAVKPTEGLSDA